YQMEGNLYQHLAETDMKAKEFVEKQVKELLKMNPAPDRNDTLAWTGHMNNLKQMAEEAMYPILIFH
ncbi:MAG: TnpV protein, partial [Lachnospiraceae bacterium]|nr:TnpV protein [Lachnospiraceae bacterium]